MKIYCDKCKKEFTQAIDTQFDKYKLGHPICSECHKEQKKYIGESELLLYLGFNELFYLILTGITKLLLDKFMVSVITIVSALAMFIIGYIGLKTTDRKIYENIEFSNKKIDTEEEIKISKSLNWQSILFFVLAISFATLDEANLFFFIVSVMAIILTFVKYYLSKKN